MPEILKALLSTRVSRRHIQDKRGTRSPSFYGHSNWRYSGQAPQ